MHINKIVDYVKNEINFSKEFCEDNVFVTLRIESILKIIENLEQSHKDILEYAKEIEKKDKYIETQEENYKNLIAGVSFIAQELELEEDGTIDEIYSKIKQKDRTINKMANYIGAIAFDNIIKKLKNDDIAYYGINGAIIQYFKQKATNNG